jgi:hypothetical protein
MSSGWMPWVCSRGLPDRAGAAHVSLRNSRQLLVVSYQREGLEAWRLLSEDLRPRTVDCHCGLVAQLVRAHA